jgi:hypothetical protein
MPAATIIRSDHPDYYGWQAAAAVGKATVLGYAYDPDGVKKAGFTSWVPRKRKIRRNPDDWASEEVREVVLGEEFLTKALDDYKQWNRAWFREIIQNSVDAGATRISIDMKQLEDGKVRVTAEDNGSGISKEVLLTKFLTIGPSGKTGIAGAAGGFGEAKRLLLFPWCDWAIFTDGPDGPIGVQSLGHGWKHKKVAYTDSPGKGTKIIVTMPADKHVDPLDCEWFVSKCNLPGVKITLNGKKLTADLEIEHKIQNSFISDDVVTFYHSPRARNNQGVFIRKNGIFMFEADAPDVKGVLIGEIQVSSVAALQASRDGFKDSYVGSNDISWLDTKFRKFITSLNKNINSAIRKSKQERTIYKGLEKVESTVENTKGKLFDVFSNHFDAAKNKKLAAQIAHDAEMTMNTLTKNIKEEPGVFLPTSGMAKIIMPDCFGADNQQTQIEAAAQQLSWAAPFFVCNEIDDYRVPSNMKPGNMAARPKKLARLWLELCRLCLIRLGVKREFGVGWIYSTVPDRFEASGFTRAAYVPASLGDGKEFLLLNPYVGADMEKKEMLSGRNKHHLYDLFSMAIHECTHLLGYPDHDESFTSALTRSMAISMPSVMLINQVRDAVAARTGEGEDGDDDEKPSRKASTSDWADKAQAYYIEMENDPALEKKAVSIIDDLRVDDSKESAISHAMDPWQKGLTGHDDGYMLQNKMRKIIGHLQSQGMTRHEAFTKMFETVPMNLCPDLISFDKMARIMGYLGQYA